MFDEDSFFMADRFFSQSQEHSFELLSGVGSVMLSAPHSVAHIRNKSLKPAERQSGVLVKMLHEDLGCPVVYKTGNEREDPNYNMVSSYKTELYNFVKNGSIKCLLDIHQLSSSRTVGIDIGTGEGKNIFDPEYVDFVRRTFVSKDVGTVLLDSPYKGASSRTVSSFISSKCRITCLQIEVNSGLLLYEKSPQTVVKVYDALAEIVKGISEMR